MTLFDLFWRGIASQQKARCRVVGHPGRTTESPGSLGTAGRCPGPVRGHPEVEQARSGLPHHPGLPAEGGRLPLPNGNYTSTPLPAVEEVAGDLSLIHRVGSGFRSRCGLRQNGGLPRPPSGLPVFAHEIASNP
jgi:hypothetical protein